MTGKRSFQFSLRKLLLWTAVVALLLGVATSLGEGVWLLACWVLVVCAIRCAFGPNVAVILSVGGGAILGGALGYALPHTDPGPDPVERAMQGVIVGGFFGLATFGIVEGAFRAVNWVDKAFEPKSDGETRRE
jgi:hypothetical protein